MKSMADLLEEIIMLAGATLQLYEKNNTSSMISIFDIQGWRK